MFDESNLTQFLDNFSAEKHKKFVEVYITSLSGHIETCQKALQDNDAAALQASTHDIKSLSYTIGAQDTGEIAESIEKDLIEDREADAFENTPSMLNAVANIIEVLKNHRATLD